jgi:type IV pilus assembly protein PilO
MALMERIDSLSARQRLLIMIVIILLLGVGFYYRVHKPKQREIQGWEAQLSTLQTDLQGLRAIAAKLPEFKEETRKLQRQLDEIKEQLPKEKEIPVLLENVSKAGTESGLEFDLFRPKPEVDKGFYMEVPVDLVVRGPFHNIATFLDKIAHFPRIMNITSFSLGKATEKEGYVIITGSCLATTYRYTEKGKT